MSPHPHHSPGVSVLLLEFVIVSHSRSLPLTPLMLTCSRDEVKSDEVTDRHASRLLCMSPTHLNLGPALPGTPVTKPVLSAVHVNCTVYTYRRHAPQLAHPLSPLPQPQNMPGFLSGLEALTQPAPYPVHSPHTEQTMHWSCFHLCLPGGHSSSCGPMTTEY